MLLLSNESRSGGVIRRLYRSSLRLLRQGPRLANWAFVTTLLATLLVVCIALGFVACGTLAIASLMSGCHNGDTLEGENKALYQCPMHPTYTSDKPGQCPICGMDTVKVAPATSNNAASGPATSNNAASDNAASSASDSRGAAVYVCPMHPTIQSDKPGECPACGMPLVRQAARSASGETGAAEEGAMHGPEDGAIPGANSGANPGANPGASPGANSGTGPGAGPTPGSNAPSKSPLYLCPMHPQITSDKPGSCPICGMDLVLRPQDTTSSTQAGAPAGYVPIEVSAEGRRLAQVQTMMVKRERLVSKVRTVGRVRPNETLIRAISLKTSGWLERLFIAFTGQQVAKGAPLATVYSPEILAAQEAYVSARDMAKALETSSSSEAKADAASLLLAARRRLELLDVPPSVLKSLASGAPAARTVTLLSPFAGYVTLKGAREGEQIGPGMTFLEVSDLSSVWVIAEVYESDLAGVSLGQRASVHSPYNPDLELSAPVSYLSPVVSKESRTVEVRLELPNPDLALRPEMFLDVTLEADLGEGPVVSTTALLETGKRVIAFVETRPGRFEPRELRLGPRAEGKARVLSGLLEGEQVVVGGNFLLDSESRIQAELSRALLSSNAAQAGGAPASAGGAP